ncbi:cytidylyltransferase domain-containing protein [Psychromonas hadalis]|uniref:acylneuraminate cytidylyltransferase family protein n=1 Tax=Psychromonas hadalis TaxID=211669 RepID=UPI0003B7A000|nr:acylneuraminate cytidylyltransferase family protein [Psychromonas hadalis]
MITAFLPCRKGSQRIPDKNVKLFAGIKGGLLSIKLKQLLACSKIDSIVVSSNDERVLDFANQFADSRIIVDNRPDHLGSSSTTTDELIKYVPSLISEGHVLWTHVTSPFINENDYSHIIEVYSDKLKLDYDSLMTVLKLQGFIWDESNPLSYNRSDLKWPMTQNIKPFYEVDSGVFLSSIDNYKKLDDRIGIKPFLLEQEKIKSVDIDWPDDFSFAEALWKQKG